MLGIGCLQEMYKDLDGHSPHSRVTSMLSSLLTDITQNCYKEKIYYVWFQSSVKLLLDLVSTVILGFRSCRDLWPRFLFFPSRARVQNGASSSTKGGVCLSVVALRLLRRICNWLLLNCCWLSAAQWFPVPSPRDSSQFTVWRLWKPSNPTLLLPSSLLFTRERMVPAPCWCSSALWSDTVVAVVEDVRWHTLYVPWFCLMNKV